MSTMEIEAIHTDRTENHAIEESAGNVVLSANGLTKAFGGNIVLDNIAFDLKKGEVVLLRGENGSGKTTLLNVLTGNLEPDSGEIHLSINGAREVFRWPRRWWQDLNPFDHFTPERIAWEGVGRVWQDIRLFPTMTALDNVALASAEQAGENPIKALMRLGRADKEETRSLEEAGGWLKNLGLENRLDSSCDKISLGQMKRVAIARAVQAGAKILFLDEPLSGLDARGVEEVMEYLQNLVYTNGLTIVIVEHVFNIPKVLDLATTIWTLTYGHLTVESKEKAKKHLDVKTDSGLHNWLKEVAGSEGAIENHELLHGARLATVIPEGTKDAPAALEVRDLVVKRGYRTVLDGLSLTLCKGQLALLEAPNGWGKSSLMDAIAGVHPIQSGEVILNGKHIHTLSTSKRVKEGLGYLRSRESVFGSLTILEHQKLSKGFRVGFTEHSSNGNSRADLLSGGQRQKLLIEMLPDSDVYLLDEPLIGLDKESIAKLMDVLKTMVKDGKAVFITVPKRL